MKTRRENLIYAFTETANHTTKLAATLHRTATSQAETNIAAAYDALARELYQRRNELITKKKTAPKEQTQCPEPNANTT